MIWIMLYFLMLKFSSISIIANKFNNSLIESATGYIDSTLTAHVIIIINNKKFNFIIDTGAATTGISEKAAFKLTTKNPIDSNKQILKLNDMQIGSIHFGGSYIKIIPDNEYKNYDDDSDGLLGMDIMHSLVLKWDFAAKSVTLRKDETKREAADPQGADTDVTALPLYVTEAHPVNSPLSYYTYKLLFNIQDKTTSRIESNFILDTGSWITVLPAIVSPKAQTLSVLHKYYESSYAGAYRPDLARLPLLALQNIIIKEPVVELSDANSPFSSGILGMDILQRFSVTMDFPHEMLYLKPDLHFHETKTWLGIGFHAEWKDKEYTIEAVEFPSPASEAKLQEGDVILSFDGNDVSTTPPADLQKIKQGWTEGSKVNLRIKRKGQESPLEISVIVRKLI